MTHPVDDLANHEFDNAATFAAFQLRHIGFTYCTMSPQDGTRYDIAIVRPPTNEQWQRWTRLRERGEVLAFNDQNRYWFATQFGPLYGWSGQEVHWSYALDHYLPPGAKAGGTQEWTARVIARFLTTLSDKLKEDQ